MSKKMIVSAVALALLATNAFADGHCASGKTLEKGKFTIATGNPAYFPWVLDDAPESGQGFEAAVAYAVANAMGFEKDDVVAVFNGEIYNYKDFGDYKTDGYDLIDTDLLSTVNPYSNYTFRSNLKYALSDKLLLNTNGHYYKQEQINIATDLRLLWTRVHREFFMDSPSLFDLIV